MTAVVFIGHSDCHGLSKELLKNAILACIRHGVVEFYNGGQGGFDRLCARTVFELKSQYPYIRNTLVIPYLSFRIFDRGLFDNILFPEELEYVHFKGAIPARNRYMVKKADAAVCYIDHTWGNAAKTYAFAQRHGLWIQNIAQALT